MVIVVACAALLTVGAVFFVWQRFQFVRLGFEVSALRKEKAALQDVMEPLEVEADYLSRLERVEALAVKTLKMRPPKPTQVRVIRGDEPARLSAE